ncbi:CGNR zinc finger domain-containing protein [Phytoactinopolyspora halotolerans]|uniref:CGNR zinc finger domain-containing protein n=1 Tax=Phytoactinopolyspora halotolerans TaxID=1981512 RepID=A0A6L9SGM5_9ACTN|nr:CGNR zinc finger domain-containing protein [Phytoactinopolyspora halotolerans]NEE03531.1 CGNR zinc finger domain-containing protein [Phytoactinopolyspora halotolerans]
MVSIATGQEAPGSLEDVRGLLNSWLIPNDTRTADDRFESYARQRRLPEDQYDTVQRLRDDLRGVVERSAPAGEVLNAWIDRLDVRPDVDDGRIGYRHEAGPAGEALVAVLEAIASGRWARLKACPDCRWVFYDHTRNASKRWCLMTAGDAGGRSCGSIAKVRAYRARARRTT